jgi:serine protease Do
VAQSKLGSTIKVKILREGKNMVLNATVVEFPQDIAKLASSKQEENISGDNELAGFSVMNLTREIAKQLGLPRNEKGVVIVSVNSYSAAEDAGLKKGDVIQEINKKRVKDLHDFNTIIPSVREGDTVLLFINRSGNKFYVTLKVYS